MIIYPKGSKVQKFQSGGFGNSPAIDDNKHVPPGPTPTRGRQLKSDVARMLHGELAPWNFSEANRLKHNLYGAKNIAKQSREAFASGEVIKPPRNTGGFDRSKYPPITPSQHKENKADWEMGNFMDAIRYEGLEGPSTEGSLGYPISKIPEKVRREMMADYDPMLDAGRSLEGPATDPTMTRDKIFSIMVKKYPELQDLYTNYTNYSKKSMNAGGTLIYKLGGRIRKAQQGVRGIKKPTPQYNPIPTDDYYSKSLEAAQPISGVDSNNEARYITQGQNYFDAQRVNSNLPGYTGTVTNVTRDEFNDYNTSMKNWQEFSDVDASGQEIFTNGMNPWQNYNDQYGENSLLKSDDVFRKNATSAFEDENLSAIDHVKGNFTNPEWDTGNHVANASPYSEYNGISSYYRNRGEVPVTPGVVKATGISNMGNVASGNFKIPLAAKADVELKTTNKGIKQKNYKPKKSNYKPEGYNYKKNKAASGSINKGKRKEKGGLLY